MTTTSDTPPAAPASDGGTAGGQRPARLERSRDDRVIAGVCGGLGRYFDIDPVIFRVVFGVSSLFGPGLLLYAGAWLFLPEENAERSVAQQARHPGGRGREVAAIALAVIVGLALFDGFILGDTVDSGFVVTLLVIGAIVWWFADGRHARLPGRPAPPAASPWPSVPPVPPAPPGPSTWWSGSASSPPETVQPPARPPAPPDRPRLGSLTLSLLLLVAGVAALLDAAEAIDLTAQGVLAGGLVLVGAGLAVGAWFGRARGLIPLGIVVTLALMAVAAVDLPFRGGFGERVWRPTAVADVTAYELVAGDATLDLTDLPLGESERTVEASVGFGELTVVVPEGVNVEVDGHVGMGVLTVFGDMQDGVDLDAGETATGEVVQLRVQVHVGMGEVVVRRAAA